MRRHVAIFVDFTCSTDHEHPHLQAAFPQYTALLKAMGRSEADVDAALRDVMEE